MNDSRRAAVISHLLPSLVVSVALLTAAVASASHTEPAVAASGGCSTSRTDVTPDAEEADLIRRINSYRADSGLASLATSPALMASAAWKSADLGANAYFAHDDLSRSWTQRIRDCGYADTPMVAENLAAGYADGAETFQQWRTSAAHNANMLDSNMRAMGVARAYTAGSPYGWYWTANFGAAATTTPVAVSGPAPSTASPAPTSASAAGALAVGGTAAVNGTGDCLRVHQVATVAAPIVGCLADGTTMVIVAGPVAGDGYRWWQLGGLGWAVDRYLTSIPLP